MTRTSTVHFHEMRLGAILSHGSGPESFSTGCCVADDRDDEEIPPETLRGPLPGTGLDLREPVGVPPCALPLREDDPCPPLQLRPPPLTGVAVPEPDPAFTGGTPALRIQGILRCIQPIHVCA